MNDFVVGCGRRYGAVGMTKLYYVRDDLALGVLSNQLATVIQVVSWAYVETTFPIWGLVISTQLHKTM
jgi:hypothetical protein